ASTTETSDYLLSSLKIDRRRLSRPGGRTLTLLSKATQGNFTVFGYGGITGNDHLEHLRQIHRWWCVPAKADE
ncbi:MAG: hypothetical protein AAF514_17380, partial [Verrucomicrobiota bacterium]